MNLEKRLARAILRRTSDLNRPTVDCIMIIGSFSAPNCNVDQAQREISSAVVWTPSGWRTVDRADVETNEQFGKRISLVQSKNGWVV